MLNDEGFYRIWLTCEDCPENGRRMCQRTPRCGQQELVAVPAPSCGGVDLFITQTMEPEDVCPDPLGFLG